MSLISPSPLLRFYDIDGKPLSGGKVYTYYSGSSIPQPSYTDQTGTVAATNPIILDVYGQAQIWLSDNMYRFNVTDANEVQMPDYPVDGIKASPGSTYVLGGNYGNDTGLSSYLEVTLDPPITAEANGLSINLHSSHTVSGQSYLNAGFGPKEIVRNDGTTLHASDILGGSVYPLVYIISAHKFYLTTPVASQY